MNLQSVKIALRRGAVRQLPANKVNDLVLSLNASALYLGIAAGSLIGGLVLQFGTVNDLGWVGALFPGVALVLFALRAQMGKRRPAFSRLG